MKFTQRLMLSREEHEALPRKAVQFTMAPSSQPIHFEITLDDSTHPAPVSDRPVRHGPRRFACEVCGKKTFRSLAALHIHHSYENGTRKVAGAAIHRKRKVKKHA